MSHIRENFFHDKYSQYASLEKKYTSLYNRLSLIRVIIFIIGIAGTVYMANARLLGFTLLVIGSFLIIFTLMVRYHQQIMARRDYYKKLRKINTHELMRLNRELDDFKQGSSFLDPHHPYAGDLDILGKYSLFQLINRCSTLQGESLLASWLLSPADKSTILKRQEAVSELTQDIDWCQEFQVSGNKKQEEEWEIKALLTWLHEPNTIQSPGRWKFINTILPLTTVLLIVAYFAGLITYYWPVGVLVINLLVLKQIIPKANKVHNNTTHSVKACQDYFQLIKMVENARFESPLLQQLKNNFYHEEIIASRKIKNLGYILDQLNNRGNIIYQIVNVIFLLDLFWLRKAENWKTQMHSMVSHWFSTINTLEALNSLAGFSFANPDYAFPVISDRPYVFNGFELGHCLIKDDQRINNDFSFEGKGAIAIITGSNMSGKSTFLRTIGTNCVLAFAGAPVCGRALEVSVTRVFTSMRTQDDLEEHMSSFYAELKRLKQLLDTIDDQTPILFLLDEVLKGTNSQDRHRGATALVKQLNQANAWGMVSTHDITLGDLENSLKGIINMHFSSTLENDEINFDYKIKNGVCKSFNASQLMEKMGIAVNTGKTPQDND